MDKQQALHNFWAGFNVPAYDENSVPDSMRNTFPRITYDVVVDDFLHSTAMSASLWDRSSSWAGVIGLLTDIESKISNGGYILPYDDGALWIKKANPWAQRMGEPSDDTIRRIFLNIEVEFISNS